MGLGALAGLFVRPITEIERFNLREPISAGELRCEQAYSRQALECGGGVEHGRRFRWRALLGLTRPKAVLHTALQKLRSEQALYGPVLPF